MWSLTQPAISGHKYRLTSREGDRKNQAESPHNAGVMSQQPNDSSQPKQKGSNKRHMAPSSQLSSCASMTVRLWHHSHSHMMPPWPCETKHTVWTTSGSTEHQQQRAWVFMSGGGATADLGGGASLTAGQKQLYSLILMELGQILWRQQPPAAWTLLTYESSCSATWREVIADAAQ